MNLYENVKSIAKSKGYSINQLEKELGFARSYISKFQEIAPSIDKVQKIADFLDVSVDYIINGDHADTTADMTYYKNDDAREMAQFMFDHPEYKVLFDATRNVKKDDIEFVKEMIERFTGNNK